MREVLVLGARRGNIGEAVVDDLAHRDGDWRGVGYHIESGGLLPPETDFARYHGLVVSLGRSLIRPIHRVGEDEMADVIRACLALPLAAAAAYVRHRDRGRVVFVGSYAHDHVLSNSVAYCSAKAGLAHAVRCLAWDYGERFRFHIVHPYHVQGTPMGEYSIKAIQDTKGISHAEALDYQAKDLRMKEPDGVTPRHLSVEEVAGAIGDLITDDAGAWTWLNGQGLNLYGGVR